MSSSDRTVAFIGLGNMGAPMVANLCSKGLLSEPTMSPLTPWKRLPQSAVLPATVPQ